MSKFASAWCSHVAGLSTTKKASKSTIWQTTADIRFLLVKSFLPSLPECLKFGVAGMIVLSPVTGRGPVCLSRSCGENIAAAAEAESRFNVGSAQETRHVSH